MAVSPGGCGTALGTECKGTTWSSRVPPVGSWVGIPIGRAVHEQRREKTRQIVAATGTVVAGWLEGCSCDSGAALRAAVGPPQLLAACPPKALLSQAPRRESSDVTPRQHVRNLQESPQGGGVFQGR